jgi:hypothetical protein
LIWELQNYTVIQPNAPIDNQYWLDIDRCNFGILEFRFVGVRGIWVPIQIQVITEFPSNSIGANGEYFVVNNQGTFSIIRKINGVWRVLERPAPGQQRGAFDPNVFFRSHYEQAPVTNLTGDVWFKYSSIYDGEDKEIIVSLKSLDSLPTDIRLSTNGEIIGKISPTTGNIFRSFYKDNTLYVAGDVVIFDNDFYVCITQYRSSGNWFLDLENWELFFYKKRSFTSFDVATFGVGRFSISGIRGNDETSIDKLLRFRVRAKDTQNVFFRDKDFTIEYNSFTNTTLTNIYLKPFLKKEVRDVYFNFITNPNIFSDRDIYRLEDEEFGVQRNPRMLLLGGIESTLAERYASAVQRNYYDRPLYFGEIKKAIAVKDNQVEYEVVYIEIDDPYEVDGISVIDKIKLGFEYDPLTADYSKIRTDDTSISVPRIDVLSTTEIEGDTQSIMTDFVTTGLDTVYPSSITLMQEELKKVTLQKTDSILVPPDYEDWGKIPELQLDGPNQGEYIDLLPVTSSEDWGNVTERTALIDDFLLTTAQLFTDDSFRPLWMNTSQDRTGNPIGYVKAVPICYVKPGKSDAILEKIRRSSFDFKNLNFTIDRLIIENAEGETGDKYIKFINRDII